MYLLFECPCYPRAHMPVQPQRSADIDPSVTCEVILRACQPCRLCDMMAFAWASRPREMREKSSFSAHARDGRTRSHRLLEDLWPVCRAFWPKHLSL